MPDNTECNIKQDNSSPLPPDITTATDLQRRFEEEVIKEASQKIIERISELSPEQADTFCHNSGLYQILGQIATQDPKKFFDRLGINNESLKKMLDQLPSESPRPTSQSEMNKPERGDIQSSMSS